MDAPLTTCTRPSAVRPWTRLAGEGSPRPRLFWAVLLSDWPPGESALPLPATQEGVWPRGPSPSAPSWRGWGFHASLLAEVTPRGAARPSHPGPAASGKHTQDWVLSTPDEGKGIVILATKAFISWANSPQTEDLTPQQGPGEVGVPALGVAPPRGKQ